MKKLLKNILDMEDVKGVMLFSFEGDIIFNEFLAPLPEQTRTDLWWGPFIDSLNGIKELDLVFDKSRLYIRKTDHGYLLVLMGIFASIAMIKLNCDTLLNSSKQKDKSRGLKFLFGKMK